MARHSLFPNSIAILYNSNFHNHRMMLPVLSVTPAGASWTLETRDSSAIDWKDAVDAFADILKTFFPVTGSVDSAELYDYESTTAPAVFLDAHEIGVLGTDGGTPLDFGQIVMPFKATGGTSLRLTVMEPDIAVDSRQSFGGAAFAPFCDLAEFVLSDDDWIITRGGTFPSVSLGYTTKENDQLRKRYFLT